MSSFFQYILRSLWLIALAFAVPHGIQGSWQSVMALTFGMIGEFEEKFIKADISREIRFHSFPDISDDDIGRIGLSQTVSMCVLGVSVAALQDRFRDKMRTTVAVMLSLSVLSYAWLALICSEVRSKCKTLPVT